ncbi:probable glycosyltransferase At3g07620 [Aristolochia californica]|uniref:probable glycosyltransferase At3g07620 n=1 Tax=Aristolochia californica TaxID=171875 RepID=UPI0035E3A3B1
MAISAVKRQPKAAPGVRQPQRLLLLLVAIAAVLSWFIYVRAGFAKHGFSEEPPMIPKVISRHQPIDAVPSSFPPPHLSHLSAASNSSQFREMLTQNPELASTMTAKLEHPYHNWELFSLDFEEMLKTMKIFVYPDVSYESSPFARIFLPHRNPLDPKLGNYYSEHMFKINLLRSSFLTSDPEEAHFFYMPFSINALRNDPRVHYESSIADFIAQYTSNISREFKFWNASKGSDHFYVYCHSVGRDAAEKHHELQTNAVQVTCSSSYFQRLFIAHKDVGLPQVWPRQPEKQLVLPETRVRLVFFAGRAKNSNIREELFSLWENDTSLDIFSRTPPFPYEEGFRRNKFCLHVKGYDVNTARISDALHYGCVPVIISNYYELPFANVLDWTKFSVILSSQDVSSLKQILLSIPNEVYQSMYSNVCRVREHFRWHMKPRGYDSFNLIAYQLWVRRGVSLYFFRFLLLFHGFLLGFWVTAIRIFFPRKIRSMCENS